MDATSLSDSAVVLLGHGTDLNSGAADSVAQHAAELRRRRVFAAVLEAFWKGQPQLAYVLWTVAAPRVFIVPLFISEGYFTDAAIPRELGLIEPGNASFKRAQNRGSQVRYYCRPVGTHNAMAEIVVSLAQNVVKQHPFPCAPKPSEAALFLAGHGTDKNENSRKAIEHQVELIRKRGLYREVHGVFLEEEPGIGQCHKMTALSNIVIVPYFISQGRHVFEGIPVLLGESRQRTALRLKNSLPPWRNPTQRHDKLIWYSPAVGSEPRLADVIIERIIEASND